ncbi:hypothetical protein CMI37_34175 [Candidatus Pacearchaeota archaeon]|nr:hypothetical protein [Candidatus Pacearchaeota archaeon]
MGTLTLTELQDELRSNLGERTDVSTARLTRFLNQAQTKIARRSNWRELRKIERQTLTYSGTALTDRFYAFSNLDNSNPRLTHSIVVRDSTQSWKLYPLPQRGADINLPVRDLYPTNKPRWYIQWGDQYEWTPVPDKAYSMEFRLTIWPAALTGSNTSDLDEKDDLILLDASRRAFRSLGFHDSALAMAKDYEIEMTDAIVDDATKPDIFATVGNSSSFSDATSAYWADPFIRRVP